MSSEFLRFPDLPFEIRAKIWKMAMPSRIIEVESAGDGMGWGSKCAPPSILQVCEESRQEAKKNGLNLRFASEKNGVTTEAKIYFDFARDTLFIGWSAFFGPRTPRGWRLKQNRYETFLLCVMDLCRTNIGEIQETDISQVQNLAIESYLPWNIDMRWPKFKERKLLDGLKPFSSTRALTLVASQLLNGQNSLYTAMADYKQGNLYEHVTRENAEDPPISHLEIHLAQHATALTEEIKAWQAKNPSGSSFLTPSISTMVLSHTMRAEWWCQTAKENWQHEIEKQQMSKAISHTFNQRFGRQARQSERASSDRANTLYMHVREMLGREVELLKQVGRQLVLDHNALRKLERHTNRDLYVMGLASYERAIRNGFPKLTEETCKELVILQEVSTQCHLWTDADIRLLLSDISRTSKYQLDWLTYLVLPGPYAKNGTERALLHHSKLLDTFQAAHGLAMDSKSRTVADEKAKYENLVRLLQQNSRWMDENTREVKKMSRRTLNTWKICESIEDYLSEKRGLPLPGGEDSVIKDWQAWHQ